MKVQILGIDLAKNVFQLHGVDRKGRGPVRLSADGGVYQPYFLTGWQPRGHLGDDVDLGGAELFGECRPHRIALAACHRTHETPSGERPDQ